MRANVIEAVDLFCGIGGLTCGLQRAGIRVVAGIDIATECKYAFESNSGCEFIPANIRELRGRDIEGMYRQRGTRVLAGCAPCPTFSSYTQGADKRRDKRWQLLDHMLQAVRHARPDVVTMENVPQIRNHFAFQRFVDGLSTLGFTVWADEINCSDFGVPQARKRLVLLASRHGSLELAPPKRSEKKTVRSAISHLEPLAAGESSETDPLHKAAGLSPVNLKRIRASKAGGTWKDWPRQLLSSCHERGNGARYTSVYGRMHWDLPAPTITTQCFNYGSGRFGHPEQDRAISLREAALLQSFPVTYRFVPPSSSVNLSAVGRMIGNAVPVRLGHCIGKVIAEHLS